VGEKQIINQKVAEDFQNKSRFAYQRGNGETPKEKKPVPFLELLFEIHLLTKPKPDPVVEERQKVLRQLEQLARENRHKQNGSH